MITEREIAEKFSVIWKQHFPLLTPTFMRVFNEAHIFNINAPIPIKENVRNDIVSEISFNIVEKVIIEESYIEDYIENEIKLKKIVEFTAKSIWKSGNFSEKDFLLNEIEITEIKRICQNLIEFIQKIKKKQVKFKPTFTGYGFIPDLVGDLSIDDTLFEIKTVNRNFRSSDLKQLLLYLALQQVSSGLNWKYAGLYNPRKGTYCKFNIKNLIYDLAGGKTPNESFENLLDSLTRDVQIDSKF
ncbi:hypothetical protein [Flavobacterium fluviatile]|uniref:hypothetical protein n=1 Tax=Flavobacterium fluviatile TaxID=1862387 RepID=UPI0013D3788F|nr:hypothetical protein [Flavobacterium fluviatile]